MTRVLTESRTRGRFLWYLRLTSLTLTLIEGSKLEFIFSFHHLRVQVGCLLCRKMHVVLFYNVLLIFDCWNNLSLILIKLFLEVCWIIENSNEVLLSGKCSIHCVWSWKCIAVFCFSAKSISLEGCNSVLTFLIKFFSFPLQKILWMEN